MKRKIIIISVVLIGFIVALSSNSWAQRERGDGPRPDGDRHFQERHGSGDRNFDRDRGPHNPPGRHFNRPGPRFKSKFQRPHHYRAPYRQWPKFRPWRHRPAYRHGHPWRRIYRRPYHSAVKQINNYYSSTESYSEPEDELTASATITDTGFAFSVGVRETN